MTNSEGSDIFDDIQECGQKKNNAKNEEKMIVTRQHMGGTYFQILKIASLQNALFFRFWHAVSRGERGQEDQG